MGVDAVMLVQLRESITDADLLRANYQIAEAMHGRVFFLSSDEDLKRGCEIRRALNRITAETEYIYEPAERDGLWLRVSLWGRYYGPGYERGNLWDYIAVAEWCERVFPAARVFYGGDSGGDGVELFDAPVRTELIAHWASKGGRPYFAGEDESGQRWLDKNPLQPTCPLCQHKATQYGTGASFASWTCDACHRHWVWIGGDRVKAFDMSLDFDSFDAAKEMAAEAKSTTR